jgi:hypothetical protein
MRRARWPGNSADYHCRGERVTVTRTLSRVVDRVEAYIFNTAILFHGAALRTQSLQYLPFSFLSTKVHW